MAIIKYYARAHFEIETETYIPDEKINDEPEMDKAIVSDLENRYRLIYEVLEIEKE